MKKQFVNAIKLGLQGRSFPSIALLYVSGAVVLTPLSVWVIHAAGQKAFAYLMPLSVMLVILAEYLYFALRRHHENAEEERAQESKGVSIDLEQSKETHKQVLSSESDKEISFVKAVDRFVTSTPAALKYRSHLNGVLGNLAKYYRLDVYGDSLLSKRAASEISFVALLLTINFLFYFFAWTSVWSLILFGKLSLSWHTIVAALGGLIFACLMLTYERQLLTADTSGRWSQRVLPITLRVLLILTSTLIISQPVELLVFSGPINSRIHEESVRLEAVRRLSLVSHNAQIEQATDQRLNDWIRRVFLSRPGSVIDEGSGWKFQDEQYDLFKKIGVLQDLVGGSPPRWPAVAEDDKKLLNQRFGLDSTTQNNALNYYRTAYWLVLFIPLVLPMLTIAFRMLLPREIHDYYSTIRQREVGFEQLWKGIDHEIVFSETA
jgi:hypothetical protein